MFSLRILWNFSSPGSLVYKHIQRKLVIIIAVLFSFAGPTAAQPVLKGFKETLHIIDGDTFVIEKPFFEPEFLCVFVERMPEAGYDVNEFISKNAVYPKYALENGIEGRVNVQFVVTEEGCIDSAKVIKSPHPSLNSEAVRLIMSLPQPWKPGSNAGKIIRTYFTYPVIFKLG